jgi:hypothetical protein
MTSNWNGGYASPDLLKTLEERVARQRDAQIAAEKQRQREQDPDFSRRLVEQARAKLLANDIPRQKSACDLDREAATERKSAPQFDLAFADDLLRKLETSHEQALRRLKTRYAWSKMAQQGFPKPRYGSSAYQGYFNKGWISPEEMEADRLQFEIRSIRGRIAHAKRGIVSPALRALVDAARYPGDFPPMVSIPTRWGREAPIPSDQYAPNMATTAARDNRLTPQAKALLQVLHARCAQAGKTETTKGTLANIMQRCERSIQRYIAELIRFGYISAVVRTNARRMYIGLEITITDLVKPFYEDFKRTAQLMADNITDYLVANYADMDHIDAANAWIARKTRRFQDETNMSGKKRFKYNYRKGDPSGVT